MTDTPDYSAWIGRSETAAADLITPRLINSFGATLAPHLAPDAVAPGLHWCLSPSLAPASGLGDDGHPLKGGFLPPIPLPRRMWAGGEVHTLAALQPGDSVTKCSTIRDIAWKTGRSGALCFVTVEHVFSTQRGDALRELHNIVYRPAATQPALPAAPGLAPKFDLEWQVPIDPVLLFRYSALTFNGHRIHYDEPYARGVEFYPGLVIHGPLQATLMLNLAASFAKATPRQFRFRGVAPATGAQTLRVGLRQVQDKAEISVLSEAGALTMQASAEW
ncbi:MAG: hypothetical protein FD162_426 [Rhodobacteraceae bacterium]|uniref:FAS1-like dehydratase domain-containing protein n=1 Tax=Cypionkella sp. TaxID=2811411 RepID=UPI00132258E6|nr:MaoC family dehydratase N-terminal domain-containing protein [Cypionkella sp.]KAF0175859.1 MAG: hypothetical protein FD162_426 [Paracoccaceae bacterium]MDO8325614.1 MaoC family dehydratase N-terminal domain-containing protein [Cypionkella sp.]